MSFGHEIQLIVGLGNPGPQYETTRHNAGAWFTHLLAESHSTRLHLESKFKGMIGRLHFAHHDCWLLIPNTYMNHSGHSIQAFANFYKIPPEAILVAHDELDFSPGVIRFKQGGGPGGHNGLRDTISCLQSKEFHRLRIGIGHPRIREEVTNYVLSRPSAKDQEMIMSAMQQTVPIVLDFLKGDKQKAIHKLHNLEMDV